jgi:hypothetical protein
LADGPARIEQYAKISPKSVTFAVMTEKQRIELASARVVKSERERETLLSRN